MVSSGTLTRANMCKSRHLVLPPYLLHHSALKAHSNSAYQQVYTQHNDFPAFHITIILDRLSSLVVLLCAYWRTKSCIGSQRVCDVFCKCHRITRLLLLKSWWNSESSAVHGSKLSTCGPQCYDSKHIARRFQSLHNCTGNILKIICPTWS